MTTEAMTEAERLAVELTSYEIDHTPDGWPAIQQKQLSAAAAELRRLQSLVETQAPEIECSLHEMLQMCVDENKQLRAQLAGMERLLHFKAAIEADPPASDPAQSSNPPAQHSESRLLDSEQAPNPLDALTKTCEGLGLYEADFGPAPSTAGEAINTPLPFDVRIGDSSFTDGAPLGSLVSHARMLDQQVKELAALLPVKPAQGERAEVATELLELVDLHAHARDVVERAAALLSAPALPAGEPLDRSAAVNLANNIIANGLTTENITTGGARILSDAVLRMDAALLQSTADHIPDAGKMAAAMPVPSTAVEQVYADDWVVRNDILSIARATGAEEVIGNWLFYMTGSHLERFAALLQSTALAAKEKS